MSVKVFLNGSELSLTYTRGDASFTVSGDGMRNPTEMEKKSESSYVPTKIKGALSALFAHYVKSDQSALIVNAELFQDTIRIIFDLFGQKRESEGPSEHHSRGGRPQRSFPSGHDRKQPFKKSTKPQQDYASKDCHNGQNCQFPNCKFRHPEGFKVEGGDERPSSSPVREPRKKTEKKDEDCRHGTGCKFPNCKFRHPNGKDPSSAAPKKTNFQDDCRNGVNCKFRNCKYQHPAGFKVEGD